MKQEISLSPVAVRQIEEILTAGKNVSVKVIREKRGTRLLIKETSSRTKYDVVFSE